MHLKYIPLRQIFLQKNLVSLLCFFPDSFPVRNVGPLILYTCFFFIQQNGTKLLQAADSYFLCFCHSNCFQVFQYNFFLFFVLPSFQKMEPSFTMVYIVLSQVFPLLISFSIFYFCLSREWNQVCQATTCSSFLQVARQLGSQVDR